MKSLEQETEAEDDLTDIFLSLFLAVEHEERAGCDTYRGDAGDIESDQDTSDGRTDICTENDARRLCKIHDAGVDEAHGHDCGCG